jgi:uncharacterized protein (TIGR02271 family)
LTAEEKAEGLVLAPRERQKIAIIVGADNPFRGDITFNQFAGIFRGEITDWSELGGEPGPIELVDRPITSDTRQALQRYGIFQQAPFVASASAIELSDDTTTAIVERLGTAGISYAIADQVTNVPGVRLVPMHGTLPNDPRYPYSQPLSYAYKSPASPVVTAFLGTAAAPVASATTPTAADPVVGATPVAGQATDDRGLAWWLLLFPVLGGLLLWFLLRSRPKPVIPMPVTQLPVTPVPITPVPVEPVPVEPVIAPILPAILDEPSPGVKLYEERLVAGKTRQKVGDVILDKRVETEQVQIAVPIKTDRVVIEHSAGTNAGLVVASDVDFGVGEVRIETYEETPDIHKEAFVYEEVRIRKEIDRETVNIEETIRREELDIDMQGPSGVAKVDA